MKLSIILLLTFCGGFITSCTSSDENNKNNKSSTPQIVEYIDGTNGGFQIPQEGIIIEAQKGLPPPAIYMAD